MKQKSIIILVAIVLAAVLVTAITVPIVTSHNTLDTPELEFVGDGIINWDAVSNADSYNVVLDDKDPITVRDPHYRLPSRGKHIIKVTAMPAKGTSFRPSKEAILDVVYTTKIAVPNIAITRYVDGGIKYVISNYDEAALHYNVTIGDKIYDVKADRGVIKAGLEDGEYDVKVQGMGDNVRTRDSDIATAKVKIAPVTVHQAEYETKTTQNDFSYVLDGRVGVSYVVADLYTIDERSYAFNKANGEFVLRESILLSHATALPQMVEIYYEDGNIEMIEITIKDNRLVELDEYVSIYNSTSAKIEFNIYRNTIAGVELVKDDGTKQVLTEGKEYSGTYDGLKAVLTINNPNKNTDRAINIRFTKDGIEPYTRTIKYYFRDSLAVLDDTHLTYNRSASNREDLRVRFNATRSDITRVELPHAVMDADYTLDNKSGLITIKRAYLDGLDEGAVITGRAYFGSDYSAFTIHVLDYPLETFHVASLDKAEYIYKTDTMADVVMTTNYPVKISAISFDGIKMQSSYAFETRGNNTIIKIGGAMLDMLGTGRHEVRVHVDDKTNPYDIVTHITIDNVDYTPHNITVSIANTYPELAISYRPVGYDVTTYVTNLSTGKRYDSVDGKKVLVSAGAFKDGDKFTVSHVRAGESKTSEEIVYHAQNISGYEKYYNAHFTYGGEQYDAVMESDREFTTFLHYALMRVSKMRAYDDAPNGVVTDAKDTMLWAKSTDTKSEYTVKIYTPYIDFDATTYIDVMKRKIQNAADTYKEPTKLDYTISADRSKPNECEISMKVSSTNVPYVANEHGHEVKPSRYKVNYEVAYRTQHPRSHSYDDFAINKWEKTQSVYLADELYYAIEDGARPVPVAGSPAEEMLEIIKDVMRSICDDSMSETEKYIAIYEWIISNVTYDHNTAIYERQIRGSQDYYKIYPRRCFFLDGVFIDKVAVCNGLSKAVVVMAGLEGIHAMKVLGYTGGTGSMLNRGQRHAWIKVNLDGIWYNSDPTWGSPKQADEPTLGDKDAEGMNHLNTLVSDKPFKKNQAHNADERFENIVSNIDIDYFATRLLGRGEDGFNTLVMSSKSDIKAAAESISLKAKGYDKVGVAIVGTYPTVANDMLRELDALTGAEWTAEVKDVTSKYDKTYRLVLFSKVK